MAPPPPSRDTLKVADFSQALATLHDRFGHELQVLVETFRKRNGELRKERLNCPNSLFQVWELLLQQVEVNSQQHGDISRDLSQSLGAGLIERLFHRKIQSKKVFAHKERIEAILAKSSELLEKCYKDYCQAYAMALTEPARYVNEYIASHNVYVHQLQATNGMVHAYQTKTLPRLLEELEECHLDTSGAVSSALQSSSELIREKSSEQAAGYQNLAGACRLANHRLDLAQFVKSASSNQASLLLSQNAAGQLEQEGRTGSGEQAEKAIRYHQFYAPNLQQSNFDSVPSFDPKNLHLVPTYKNEIAPDFSQPPDQQKPKLELDRASLEEKIEKFEERIESLAKLLGRSRDSKLHNKVNELQEELSQRKFDLYVAQIHLSAVRSQLQLFEYNFRPISSVVGSDGALIDYQETAVALGAAAGQTGGAGGQASEQGSNLAAAGGQSRRSPQSVAGAGGALGSAGGSTGPSAGSLVAPLGYRSKWIKAFKSLKETPAHAQAAQKFADLQMGPGGELADSLGSSSSGLGSGQPQGAAGGQLQQQLENQHHFQEYTFKKIASCDVCKDFLRGHMRQGVKCKLCKISCHNDCQAKAHGTIKCQQPKIKLLRRQKSAGELEVNVNSDENVDPSERASSSKPDSIYSLIRQVLDAKKRGQHGAGSHAPQTPAAPGAAVTNFNPDDYNHLRPNAFARSQAINLSTGNLALANANGKSVSTSALQSGGGGSGSAPRPEASVDRWAVVMELLAQSRRSNKEQQAEEGAGAGGKRHSKQLDKFKLAARSVGKHQRHQRSPIDSSMQPQSQQQQATGQLSPSSPSQQQQSEAAAGQYGGAGGQEQHSSQLLIHHTKSLPVGQLAPGQLQQQQQQQAAGAGQFESHSQRHRPPIGLPTQALANYRPADAGGAGQEVAALAHHLGQTISNPIGPAPAAPQSSASGQQPYELLELQQQQIQSTSAPHSPRRKRFNLRMKSFSLDSPESPQLAGVAIGYGHQPGASSSTTSCNQSGASGGSSAALHYGAAPGASQHTQPTGEQFMGQHHVQFQRQREQHQQQQPLHHQLAHQTHQQQAHNRRQQQHQQQPRAAQHQSRTTNLPYELRAQQQQPQSTSYGAGQMSSSTFSYYDQQQQQQQQLYGRQTNNSTLRAGQPQQHRHSYHNQMPAAAYAYVPELGEDNRLGAFDGASASFLAQLGAGRQCASQSSLNLHSAAATGAPSASTVPSDSNTNKGNNGNDSAAAACSSSSNNNNNNNNNNNATNTNGGTGAHSTGAANSNAKSAVNSSQLSGYQESSSRQKQELGQGSDYYDQLEQQQQHQRHQHHARTHDNQAPHQLQQQAGPQPLAATNTFVVLYDYVAQRGDEIQMSAGQLVQLLDTSERDWWKVAALDGTNRIGYFPSSYLAQLYQNERPLQVAQTIQVSNGETCDKLLRGQIVIHTGKQMDNFVTIRTIKPNANPNEAPSQALVNYIQCPEKYLIEF